ncbi:lectin-like protein [Punica granatum]|uniref:Legume lectin domain-containing protein n=2 Tax=Punica granatum TaxID=22663 RepID=A0A218WCS0_PUNGR|nr:lectin-like protein [Punica granatum]OWM70001.1 hypothetical protein CDL15_Pgr025850 [Punica granatum]PKI43579.1 hypothetical protein CRG98_036009 [Punica granatum]
MAGMAPSRVSTLVFPLAILLAFPTSSLSLRTPVVSSDFDRGIELLGDAAISGDGSRMQITRSTAPSSGLLMRSAPLRFATPISFSTDFTFSISPGSGDGLALVLFSKTSAPTFGSSSFGLSKGDTRFVGVEFDTSMDENVGDLNDNHVGIDLGSFVSVSASNVSSMNLMLNSGEKLRSWIDYDASSKRIEVRLGRFGEPRPYNPLVAHLVDLSKIWNDEEDVLIGLSSSNGNSVQTSSIYSWRFKLRKFLNSMHSMPADPNENKGGEHADVNKKRACPVALLGGLVIVALLGALLLALMQSLWAIAVEAFRVDYPEHRVDFQYEKIGVVVGKDGGGGKN